MLKRFGPGALIAVGGLVLLAAIGYGAYAEALANPGAAAVPDVVAGARLVQKTVGPEAVAEVTRLHGKEFPLTSGAMATYGNGTATLWVTGVPASPMAAEMVRAMTNKIAEGRSPFRPMGTREIHVRAVYELGGMGQRHFYFQSGSLVIWLAADEAIAEKALMETLTFYP
jgi:hypothetical protein